MEFGRKSRLDSREVFMDTVSQGTSSQKTLKMVGGKLVGSSPSTSKPKGGSSERQGDDFDPRMPLTRYQLIKYVPTDLLADVITDQKLLSRPYVEVTDPKDQKLLSRPYVEVTDQKLLSRPYVEVTDQKLLSRPYVEVQDKPRRDIEKMLSDIDWDDWSDHSEDVPITTPVKRKHEPEPSPVIDLISSDSSNDSWKFVSKKKSRSEFPDSPTTPSGREKKPTTPSGGEKKPTTPSGREKKPTTPSGGKKPVTPSGREKKKSRSEFPDSPTTPSGGEKSGIVIEDKSNDKGRGKEFSGTPERGRKEPSERGEEKKESERRRPVSDWSALKSMESVKKSSSESMNNPCDLAVLKMNKPCDLAVLKMNRPCGLAVLKSSLTSGSETNEKSAINEVIKSKKEEQLKKMASERDKLGNKAMPLSMKQRLEIKARISKPIQILSTSDIGRIHRAKKSCVPSSGVYHSRPVNVPKDRTAVHDRAKTPDSEKPVLAPKVRLSHICSDMVETAKGLDTKTSAFPRPLLGAKQTPDSPVNPLLKECVKPPKPVVPISIAVNQVKNRVVQTSQKKLVSVDPYIADMLCWSPKWLSEADMVKTPPPLHPRGLLEIREEYESPEHYAATQIPYIMYEVWENCLESYRSCVSKKGNVEHRKIPAHCTHYETTATFLKIRLESAPNSGERAMRMVPSEGDIVVLDIELDETCEPVGSDVGTRDSVFGFVTESIVEGENHKLSAMKAYKVRQGCTQIIHFSIMIRKKPIRINQGKPVKILRLEYIKPAIKHMEAVLRLRQSFLLSDILKPRKMTCQMAFPTVIDLSSHPEYNLSQNQAILGVVEALRRPQSIPKIQLIQGPPGTGKTHTLVGMIKEIYLSWTPWIPDKLPKLLVCAPSNGAVDEIGKRLYSERHFMKKAGKEGARSLRIVRAGQDENLTPDMMQISLEYLIDANMSGRTKEEDERFEKKLVALESKIADVDIQISNLRVTGDFEAMNNKEAEMVRLSKEMERVRREKQFIDASSASSSGQPYDHVKRMKTRDDILKNADIILVTLNSCRSSYLESVFNPRDPNFGASFFQCVIIDEASQCSEPEVLMPLAYTSISKMILIGDPMQLPATIKSTVASSAGYGRSLFERFFNFFKGYNPENPVHMLNEQYRMRNEICSFPARMFYDNRLTSHPKAGLRSLPDGLHSLPDGLHSLPEEPDTHYYPFHPYTVIDVQNTAHSSAGNSKSLQNIDEAEFVIRILKLANNYLTSDTKIGVITPYQGQKKILIGKINACPDVRGLTVDVNTVDGFQGQERDFIIFSSVRSDQTFESQKLSNKSIGFLDSHQRLNVALTRAKYAMVICVSRASLSHNFLWKSLIDDALERKRLFPLDSKSTPKQISSILITNAFNIKSGK